MKPTNLISVAALAALSLVATSAQATQIIAASTGINAPSYTLSFDEVVLPDSSSLTNQYLAYGVSFSGLFYNPCKACVSLPAKPDVGNFTFSNTGSFNSGFDIHFASAVNGASFRFASNGGSFTFQAYNGSTLVDSFVANGAQWGNYGFEGFSFNRLHVTSPSALLIDNLSVAAVPEVETYAMMLAGLALIGVSSRRRKTA